MLEFLIGGAPIYLPVIGFILKIVKCIKIKAEISESAALLEEAKREYSETEAFLKNNAEIQIPPRFRLERALEYSIKGLKAREFITLEPACFRCEEAMRRGEIPDNYSEF